MIRKTGKTYKRKIDNVSRKHSEHYYSKKPRSKPRKIIIKTKINTVDFKFYSSSSIFSKAEVDKASLLLIDKAIVEGDTLDLGCGYGAIGIAVKTFHPEIGLFMSDCNYRAFNLARKNVQINNIEALVRRGDSFKPWKGRKFDTILLNPPMSAGRQLCKKLIEDSYEHLNEGGILEIVAYHNKGGEVLSEIMFEKFNNIKTLAKKGGFRIYASRKKTIG